MRTSLVLCAAAAVLAACATPQPPAPAPALNTSHIDMHVAAGNYNEMRIPHMNDGAPVAVKLTISDPHDTTKWLPSASLCVIGDDKNDSSCLQLYFKRATRTLVAATVSTFSSPLANLDFAPFSGQFGKPVNMVLKYDARGYTIDLDGQPFPVAPVDFEITGYSILCSSALCRFDLQ
jgi:hypothetical protein